MLEWSIMTYNIQIFSILLVCLSTFHFVPNTLAEQFSLQSSGNERAIKYKPRSAAGPTTRRPTWRPAKVPVKEVQDATFPDPDHDPDSRFAEDYYDSYDGEIEGTRRNIFLHNTFEERMKTYNKLMQSQNNNNKATQDILQKTLKVAKEEQKKRNAAKKKSRNRKAQGRAIGQNKQQQQQVQHMLSTLLT